jgi:hypothetical protein
MKYLSNYIQEGQTKAFEEAGAFFAFSDKHFLEARKEGVKYVHLGGGLLCPKDTANKLVEDLDRVHKAGIEQDIKENGIDGIIDRELANHEVYWCGGIENAIEALSEYPCTKEDIYRVYKLNFQRQNA